MHHDVAAFLAQGEALGTYILESLDKPEGVNYHAFRR
jgi:hypothetical protein